MRTARRQNVTGKEGDWLCDARFCALASRTTLPTLCYLCLPRGVFNIRVGGKVVVVGILLMPLASSFQLLLLPPYLLLLSRHMYVR